MSATKSHLTVGNATLSIWAEGLGPVVVLVHGTGCDARTWDSVTPALSKDFTVVTYDRRGYGESKHSPILDHRIHADDLIALIESLNKGKVHVVGWSSGGVVALDVATRRPDLIDRLIVMEAPARGMSNLTPGMIGMMLNVTRLGKKGKPEEAVTAFYEWAAGTKDGSSGFARARDEERAALVAYHAVVLTELQPSKVGSLGGHIQYKGLRDSAVPITWFLGGDSIPWYSKLASKAARVAPNITLRVIPNASHIMHREQPEAFVAAVNESLVR